MGKLTLEEPDAWTGEPPADLVLKAGEEIIVIERRAPGIAPIKVSMVVTELELSHTRFFITNVVEPAMGQLLIGDSD